MMAAMDSWDVVVVWKLNRLHRTMRGFVQDGLKLAEAKKDLASITESLDTSSAMGKLVYHLLGALSEFESDQTSERVKSSFAEKFKSDETAWFTRAPLGYDLVNGELVVNEAEAVRIRKVFELVRAGRGIAAIAREMNLAGWRGKNRGKCSMVQVVQIAHNPAYAGYVYYRGQLKRNAHEAIVTDEEFNAAQVALYVRGRRGKRWPLIAGADRIEAVRIATSGDGASVYLPKVRPPGLEDLVRAEMLRNRKPSSRPGRASRRQ
jgi:site-specific DNA recombinase